MADDNTKADKQHNREYKRAQQSSNTPPQPPDPPPMTGDGNIHRSIDKQEARQFEKNLRNLKKESGGGLKAHLTAFLAVNTFLIYLNIATGSHFPWFFFPLAGWGIGLAAHIQSFFNSRNKRRILENAKTKTKEQQYLIQKLSRVEGSFKQHRTAFFSTSFYLFGINQVTSSNFPWFFFPVGAWAVGFLIHAVSFFSKKQLILKALKGVNWKQPPKTSTIEQRPVNDPQGFYTEAMKLKEEMLEDLKQNKDLKAHWGGDLEMLLEKFTNQIKDIVHLNSDIESAIKTIDSLKLKEELEILEHKRIKTESKALIIEYDKSISQYKHQLKSISELHDKQEIVQLRLNSAMVLMKQLKLDSARIKNLKSMEEPYTLKEIRQKSDELSQYLDDYNDLYPDLDI